MWFSSECLCRNRLGPSLPAQHLEGQRSSFKISALIRTEFIVFNVHVRYKYLGQQSWQTDAVERNWSLPDVQDCVNNSFSQGWSLFKTLGHHIATPSEHNEEFLGIKMKSNFLGWAPLLSSHQNIINGRCSRQWQPLSYITVYSDYLQAICRLEDVKKNILKDLSTWVNPTVCYALAVCIILMNSDNTTSLVLVLVLHYKVEHYNNSLALNLVVTEVPQDFEIWTSWPSRNISLCSVESHHFPVQ